MMQRIITQVIGRQGLLIMNRPEQQNALDDVSIAEMIKGLAELEANPAVRVIVLAAKGNTFCAGADLYWLQCLAEKGDAVCRAGSTLLSDLLKAFNNASKPTIARVHGSAYGLGVALIAVCDIAITTFGNHFVLPETKLGLVSSMTAPYVIAAIGAREARRYMLTAEKFSASEAYRIGLLHEVVMTTADLDEMQEAWVNALCTNSPSAINECKKLIALLAGQKIDDRLIEQMRELFVSRCVSEEGREGVAAFLEDRQPAFAVPGIGDHSTVQ